MDVFDKSIKGLEFKNQLNRAVSHFEKKDYYFAENELRTALTIFSQSKNLESYDSKRRKHGQVFKPFYKLMDKYSIR